MVFEKSRADFAIARRVASPVGGEAGSVGDGEASVVKGSVVNGIYFGRWVALQKLMLRERSPSPRPSPPRRGGNDCSVGANFLGNF